MPDGLDSRPQRWSVYWDILNFVSIMYDKIHNNIMQQYIIYMELDAPYYFPYVSRETLN